MNVEQSSLKLCSFTSNAFPSKNTLAASISCSSPPDFTVQWSQNHFMTPGLTQTDGIETQLRFVQRCDALKAVVKGHHKALHYFELHQVLADTKSSGNESFVLSQKSALAAAPFVFVYLDRDTTTSVWEFIQKNAAKNK